MQYLTFIKEELMPRLSELVFVLKQALFHKSTWGIGGTASPFLSSALAEGELRQWLFYSRKEPLVNSGQEAG
jgi:hypothetical protein